ncbi:MAG: type I toxin-antitoxin system SymE family toxin [Planctomycetes bacterium]|nr:type I toxin-antitoxin system SymE family toxin [Planctomycetota bacterium]
MKSSIEKEKKERIKINTVGHRNRQARTPEGFPYDKKPVPMIKLSGLWLEKIGFEIGKKYIVKVSHSQVSLLLKDWCDNASSASRSTTDNTDEYVVKLNHSQVKRFLKECDNNESRSTTKKSVGTRHDGR